jgi:uncharacterized protein
MATTTILWTGREYHSLENCQVDDTPQGTEVRSAIVGRYGGTLYAVDYLLQTDTRWHTRFVDIKARINGRITHLQFESDGQGRWSDQGKNVASLQGCTDVDIPLTPFTNTLPINRLKLAVGGQQQIQVLYIDLLEDRIVPVRQHYKRLAPNIYHYENIPNDFEADIQVDDAGFVMDYPTLFGRADLRRD